MSAGALAGMPDTPVSLVTLDDCDREPIHIPGSIQPLGCLLAFDAGGRLRYYSENAQQLLGTLPALGAILSEANLDRVPDAYRFISDYLIEMQDSEALIQTQEIASGLQVFDLVLHVNQQLVVAEFELRQKPSENINLYSTVAQKALNALKKQKTIDTLLHTAAEVIRTLTGFDRVMVYRFRYDDSGEVAAEAHRADLDSLLGRRYPAGDIPAQARRMYIANTLRLIADVDSAALAVVKLADSPPLDMSYCVLRSVSPIHIEYLKNMGVSASMSVSIVIDEKLWGMIACHHMSPYQVPYSIRTVCDVMCKVIGSSVQFLEKRAEAVRQQASNNVRAGLLNELLAGGDFAALLFRKVDDFAGLIACDAVFMTFGEKFHLRGTLEPDSCLGLSAWLAAQPLDFYHFSSRADAPPALIDSLNGFCGLLAINIDKVNRSWLVFLRVEQIHTVRWGGKPEKHYVPGPLGMRLTPRGSFEEWKETVKDQAEPWSTLDLDVAHDLHSDLLKVFNARNAEIEKARIQLLAVLGHDLRDPLHSISMAAQMLGQQDGSSRLGKLSKRIQNSSGRMQRLVNQVMDISKLQTGLGLDIAPRDTNLSALIEDVVQEHQIAYPATVLRHDIEAGIHLHIDEDRIAQLIANLLSNARSHGTPEHPITLGMRRCPAGAGSNGNVQITVANAGAPIADDIIAILFDPFKRQSAPRLRAKEGLGLGLGLGLYISHEIVKLHGGNITYRHAAGQIVFTVALPLPT